MSNSCWCDGLRDFLLFAQLCACHSPGNEDAAAILCPQDAKHESDVFVPMKSNNFCDENEKPDVKSMSALR